MSSGAGSTDLAISEVLSILSRPDDADLREVVELVATICECQSAGITILRGTEYHVPITYGLEPLVCSPDDTFCAYTMGTDGVFAVEDATLDPRFADIGFVDGRLATSRAYASAPLYAPSGQMVGRLCVIDPVPRKFTDLQRRSLETLALSVTKVIELRLLQSRRLIPLTPLTADLRQATATVKSQLAAELSHDMRVPLSSIVASVEMLEDELENHSDRAVSTLLNRMTRAANRMARMLDQHLDASDRAVRQQVDLDRVAHQLVLDSTMLLEQSGGTIEVTDLPVVQADPDGVYSVLQNLVTNSLKFARPGVPALVQISARRTHDSWRISVSDNGVGIPEDRRVDVFSLFSRVDNHVEGHGIGLATVARIIGAHGGRAGAEAEPGGGAEIWFELPDLELDDERPA